MNYYECPLQVFPEFLVNYTDDTLPDKCGLCITEATMPVSSDSIQVGYGEALKLDRAQLVLRNKELAPYVYDIAIGYVDRWTGNPYFLLNCIKRARVHCINEQLRLF